MTEYHRFYNKKYYHHVTSVYVDIMETLSSDEETIIDLKSQWMDFLAEYVSTVVMCSDAGKLSTFFESNQLKSNLLILAEYSLNEKEFQKLKEKIEQLFHHMNQMGLLFYLNACTMSEFLEGVRGFILSIYHDLSRTGLFIKEPFYKVVVSIVEGQTCLFKLLEKKQTTAHLDFYIACESMKILLARLDEGLPVTMSVEKFKHVLDQRSVIAMREYLVMNFDMRSFGISSKLRPEYEISCEDRVDGLPPDSDDECFTKVLHAHKYYISMSAILAWIGIFMIHLITSVQEFFSRDLLKSKNHFKRNDSEYFRTRVSYQEYSYSSAKFARKLCKDVIHSSLEMSDAQQVKINRPITEKKNRV